MKRQIEKLHPSTPAWFRNWYENCFFHFQTKLEVNTERVKIALWLVGILLAGLIALLVAMLK